MLLVASCYRNQNKLRPDGPLLARMQTLPTFFIEDQKIWSVSGRHPDNKQLLDEVEHDIMNYQNRGLCYLQKLKAEADNTDMRF